MSYAPAFHLLDGHGPTQPSGIDRYFKQTLATSVAFHVLVLIVLLSIRVTPVYDRPLASYQIELVDLSEPQAVSSPAPVPEKKPAVPSPPVKTPQPVAPAVSPPPVPVEPQERLAETFAGALKGVTVPEARAIPPTSPKTQSTNNDKVPVPAQVQEQPLNMQAPPDAPKLTTRDRSAVIPESSTPSVSKSAPLAKSLQQAVEAVPVPPSKHRSSQTVPAESKAASPKKSRKTQPLAGSRSIMLPPEAPKLADAAPVVPLPDRTSKRMKTPPLSETLQQAVKSVVIPDMKAARSQGKTPSHPNPKKSQPVMPKIVQAPQAPKLATIDSSISKPDQSKDATVAPPFQPNHEELASRIAKLTIPDVDVSQPHETLKRSKASEARAKTKLKVSGSSPDGNPYWGRVWAKIDQEWVAPPISVHKGNVLQVILEFRLERSGTVKNLTIQQTSGNGYYDLAAKRAVLAAAPLPGFPPDMTQGHFTLQFQFTVNEQ